MKGSATDRDASTQLEPSQAKAQVSLSMTAIEIFSLPSCDNCHCVRGNKSLTVVILSEGFPARKCRENQIEESLPAWKQPQEE